MAMRGILNCGKQTAPHRSTERKLATPVPGPVAIFRKLVKIRGQLFHFSFTNNMLLLPINESRMSFLSIFGRQCSSLLTPAKWD